MNPGPMEEAGKAASGIVEGLKQQPLLLAMVVLQVVLLGTVTWASAQNRAADRDRFALVMSLCGPKE